MDFGPKRDSCCSVLVRHAVDPKLTRQYHCISRREPRLLLKTKQDKEIYAKRKSTVKPVIGIVKSALGFRQFLLRGLENVNGEWNLVALGWNLKRMFNMKSGMPA